MNFEIEKECSWFIGALFLFPGYRHIENPFHYCNERDFNLNVIQQNSLLWFRFKDDINHISFCKE